MFTLLSNLIAITQCVVGAGLAGTIAAKKLKVAFNDHEIVLIDKHFNGGTLSQVKDELSITESEYKELIKELNFGKGAEFNIVRDRHKVTEVAELFKQIREYMVNHNLVQPIQAEVLSIDLEEDPKYQIRLILSETKEGGFQKCDYVHMALGGSPRKPFELIGNPQIFNMFESLNYLNSEYVGEADLSGGNIYIVGEGDTAKLIIQKLEDKMPHHRCFYLVKRKLDVIRYATTPFYYDPLGILTVDEFKQRQLKEEDIVFYANGLELETLPTVFYKNKGIIMDKRERGRYTTYTTFLNSIHYKIYALGLMQGRGSMFVFVWAIKTIINDINKDLGK
eukprot:NODE_940_length_2995_cov_0.396409.p2 type:complete len:336 gc:universal NODE_940_length_2995_cov_0.396409:1377-2384(+)